MEKHDNLSAPGCLDYIGDLLSYMGIIINHFPGFSRDILGPVWDNYNDLFPPSEFSPNGGENFQGIFPKNDLKIQV